MDLNSQENISSEKRHWATAMMAEFGEAWIFSPENMKDHDLNPIRAEVFEYSAFGGCELAREMQDVSLLEHFLGDSHLPKYIVRNPEAAQTVEQWKHWLTKAKKFEDEHGAMSLFNYDHPFVKEKLSRISFPKRRSQVFQRIDESA